MCTILDVAMLVITASLILYLFTKPAKMHCDVDRSIYPVKGIDISAHNGIIDFHKVAADSVTFVMLKATEGSDFCDANFSTNYAAAREAGLLIGAYHFFRFNSPGEIQAEHLLKSVEHCHLDLPLAIDVEKWGNAAAFNPDSVKTQLRAMITTLRKSGYPVIIYTNKHGYETFINEDFTDIPLWICSLSMCPNTVPWVLWQHSHRGEVKGIDKPVDLNTFNGDHSKFADFAAHGGRHTHNNDTNITFIDK